MQDKIVEIISKRIPDDGWHIWGFADLSGLLHERFKGYSHGITIGKRLDDAIMDSVVKGPNIQYYDLYKQTNAYLSDLVTGLASDIEGLGVKGLVIRPNSSPDLDRSPDYSRTLRHRFSHKMVGTRAGLGWIGKTDLFISRKFGPRLRLASILVDYHLRPLASPLEKSLCGKCNICVDACPAGAASGKLWNTRIDRDEFYDAFKCQQKAKELSSEWRKQDDEICGICIAVCPVGKKGLPESKHS
ncbi:MAG: 4Fe-4S dicluster domain-containing protein [Chloroflexi bacterium]|nr:4Fe-4S dicluster domain-containing protein [Chloroflexota bacterium]